MPCLGLQPSRKEIGVKHTHMNKLVNNPAFAEDEPLDASPTGEGDEEVKPTKPDEGSEDEDIPPEPSAGTPPPAESGEAEHDAPRQREIEALEREEAKIREETKRIDAEVKARRQAVVEARRERREMRDQLKEVEPPAPERVDDLSDIDQEDVQRMERVLRAKGFAPVSVLKEEQYREDQKRIEAQFFAEHPEYKPENDANDTLYNALKDEFGLYARPKSAAQVKVILERAHREVTRQFPDRFPRRGGSSAPGQPGKSRASLAGAGTGAPGASGRRPASPSTLTPEQRQHLHGFSEEELEGM